MSDNLIKRNFQLEKQVPKGYFAASWHLWQVGKPVTAKSLTALLEAQGEKIDARSVSVMVEIADFLSAACPA